MKIGIDVGGSSIKCGLVNQEGLIIKQTTTPTPQNLQENLSASLISIVEDLISSFTEITSIGIGIPGILDKEKGLVKLAANLNLKDYPITAVFDNHPILKNIPLTFDGDAQCAALAEHFYGAAKGKENSVTLTIGTGLGCGVIIDHKPLTNIPEIGHHIINAHGFKCACGRVGCLEAYVSVTGIKNLLKDFNFHVNKDTFIDDFFTDDHFKMAKNQFYQMFAMGLSNITYLYWPKTIVIGGGLSHYIEQDLDHLTTLYKNILITPNDQSEIRLAQYKNDAGILGATLLNK